MTWMYNLNRRNTRIHSHSNRRKFIKFEKTTIPTLVQSKKLNVCFLKTSDVYLESGHGAGYYGSGIVVAVLDTGVDNEHTSLNDFDDINDSLDKIKKKLDHKCINDIKDIGLPTLENISSWIGKELKKKIF